MKKTTCILSYAILFGFSAILLAADFKPYPGAKIDEKATEESKKVVAQSGMAGTKPTIYTTADSFEKVYAFYNGIAKEYQMPGQSKAKPKTLPSGQTLKEAYFIFDGAGNLMSSKLWIKIQRPYIGSVKMEGFTPKYEDIRDVTAIVVSEKK